MKGDIYYRANDNLIELVGLIDAVTGDYINNATVAVTLTNEATGAQVAGETWPLSMPYVATSNGDYRGVLQNSLTVAQNAVLKAVITVDAGLVGQAQWTRKIVAVDR